MNTGFCRVLLGFIGFFWLLSSFTGFYRVLLRIYLILLGLNRFYWFLLVFTGFP